MGGDNLDLQKASMTAETLRNLVRQAEKDNGGRPGVVQNAQPIRASQAAMTGSSK